MFSGKFNPGEEIKANRDPLPDDLMKLLLEEDPADLAQRLDPSTAEQGVVLSPAEIALQSLIGVSVEFDQANLIDVDY